MYPTPLSSATIQRLGDWFVESINYAVTTQSLTNPEAILTADQLAQIEAEISYQETLYPHILDSTDFTNTACTSDAGATDN